MNGTQLYQAVQTMYSNFGIDPTLFLQFVNVARSNRELQRPWMRLRKVWFTQTVTPANQWNTPIPMPTDFEYLTEDGQITLFDGIDTYQDIDEVPYTMVPQYKDYSNKFAIDHPNQDLYIMGIIGQNYNIWMPYQADYGDITNTTTWTNIPSRFHMMLAFDALAMYEMGVDYDDLQARNANGLAQQAELLFNSMVKWDDRLQRSATTRVDYGETAQDAPFVSNRIMRP